MPTERKLNFGDLLNASLALAWQYRKLVGIYIAGITAVIVGFEMSSGKGDGYWPGLIADFLASYFLMEAVLRDQGITRKLEQGVAMPAFFGVWCLTWLGLVFGAIAMILPGLILAARWMMALPLTIAGENAVFAAMKQSWEATRRSQWALVGFLAIYYTASLMFRSDVDSFAQLRDGAITANDITSGAVGLVAIALGRGVGAIGVLAAVVTFQRLSDAEPALDTIFS